MNRSTFFILGTLFLFTWMACMKPTNVSPNTTTNNPNFSASQKSSNGNIITTKGVTTNVVVPPNSCGSVSNVTVSNPYLPNSPTQPITISWTPGSGNTTYDIKITNTLTGLVVYAQSGLTTTTITTTPIFTQTTPYQINLKSICPDGSSTPVITNFTLGGGPTVLISDNLDAQAGSGALGFYTGTSNICTTNNKNVIVAGGNCASAPIAPSSGTSGTEPYYYVAFTSYAAGSIPCTLPSLGSQKQWSVFRINYVPTIGSNPGPSVVSGIPTSNGAGILFNLPMGNLYRVKLYPGTKSFHYAAGGMTYPPLDDIQDGFLCP